MNRKLRLGFLLMSCTVFSCTFHSSQMDVLLSAVQKQQDLRADFQWEVILGSAQYKLVAIDNGIETLFSESGVGLIAFNGWSIIQVVGFDLPSAVIVQEVSSNHIIYNIGGAARSGFCNPWKRELLIWKQNCTSVVEYTNYLELNDAGEIIRIDQFYDGKNRIVLRKL